MDWNIDRIIPYMMVIRYLLQSSSHMSWYEAGEGSNLSEEADLVHLGYYSIQDLPLEGTKHNSLWVCCGRGERYEITITAQLHHVTVWSPSHFWQDGHLSEFIAALLYYFQVPLGYPAKWKFFHYQVGNSETSFHLCRFWFFSPKLTKIS